MILGQVNSVMAQTAVCEALGLIEEDAQQILADLRTLISVSTAFPPGENYLKFADVLEPMAATLGFACKRVEVPQSLWDDGTNSVRGARINLIAERESGAAEICSLYFHVDTVPAGDGWTSDPFDLTEREGKLHGRGTADMKGAIVAAFAALRAAMRLRLPLRFDPVLLFCTDEEGGLYPGIRFLAEQGLVKGHLLNFNGGALPRIWAGCFGSVDMLIRVTGRSAHSGDPVGGINAIEESIPLLVELQRLKLKVEQRASAMPAPPHFGNLPLTSRLNIALAKGGSKGSIVPAQFEVLVNRRYAPEEQFDDVMRELAECVDTALRGSRALSVEHRVIGHLAPVNNPVGPHWPRWQAALGAGFGYAPSDFSAWGSSTSSDMGWVQRAGIREILLGGLARPDNRVHAADEYTTMRDVMSLAKSILAYLSADFEPA
jgi:succinyl-diaminopimelate desuccinylase